MLGGQVIVTGISRASGVSYRGMPPRPMRFVWLIAAAFAVVLAPALTAVASSSAPADSCAVQSGCGDRDATPSSGQSAKECYAGVACSKCCFAVLPLASLPSQLLGESVRWEHAARSALQRSEPPPLPPPRAVA